MRVQLVQHQHHLLRLCIWPGQQFVQEPGPVLLGPPGGHFQGALANQRLTGQKPLASTLFLGGLVFSLDLPRFRGIGGVLLFA